MKFQNFSIAKIEFLWRALNFKRGHGPLFSAAYEFEAIYNFCSQKDIFVSLPTGFGKSLIYGLLPMVFDTLTGNQKL